MRSSIVAYRPIMPGSTTMSRATNLCEQLETDETVAEPEDFPKIDAVASVEVS